MGPWLGRVQGTARSAPTADTSGPSEGADRQSCSMDAQSPEAPSETAGCRVSEPGARGCCQNLPVLVLLAAPPSHLPAPLENRDRPRCSHPPRPLGPAALGSQPQTHRKGHAPHRKLTCDSRAENSHREQHTAQSTVHRTLLSWTASEGGGHLHLPRCHKEMKTSHRPEEEMAKSHGDTGHFHNRESTLKTQRQNNPI